MRKIVLVIVGFAALWGAYEGWAYHQRSLGRLEAAIADDVRVNDSLGKREKALERSIPGLLQIASKATDRAVAAERRRRATIVASDSAAAVTDAAIHSAEDAATDSTTKAKLDSVKLVVGEERAARNRERASSDSAIEDWKFTAVAWMHYADTAWALAGTRKGRIDALEAENKKIRALVPSRTGNALRVVSALSLTALACHFAKC